MTTINDILTRWAERGLEPEKRERHSRSCSVFTEDDTVYSYGRHFPMADIYRDSKDIARLVLINGDRYSVTTSGHQSRLRSTVANILRDVPSVIIPYSALAAAGINRSSIELLEAKPDGWEDYPCESEDMPKNAFPEPINGSWGRIQDARGTWREVSFSGGKYYWKNCRHWLGEAVISARVHGSKRRTKYLSGFDRNEKRRLYFFCELPATKAVTVEQAIESLKPDAVKMAEAMGRECERQGDIFAVPMPGLTLPDLKRDGGQVVTRSSVRRGDLMRNRCARLLERLTQAEDVRFRTPEYLLHLENMKTAVFGNLPWGTTQARPIVNRWQRNAYAENVGNHRRNRWEAILQARVEQAYSESSHVSGISLLGTAHTATHVVTMPDGTQYARGTMYHDPALMGEARERDHDRRKLSDGKTWHLVQKNTVPVAKQRTRTR